MTSEITVYESSDFGSIRAFEEDGEVYVVADDLAKSLGYHEAKDMVRSLEADEFTRHTVPGNRGNREANVVNEAGVYHAILMRKTACVKDPVARERVESFQRWVTHEVLPSIRRNGAYVNPYGAESFDELMARALAAANEVLARREARIREMRPKAALGEAVSASTDAIPVGDLARLLHQNGCEWSGRNRLYERLRDDGYLIRGGAERNRPLQRWVDRGLFEVQESTYRGPDGTHVSFTTRVTPKGQAHFLRRYAGVAELEGMVAE